MEEILQRQTQLRSLVRSLAPVATQTRSSPFLAPFSPDVSALLSSVENSLALYTLFEKHQVIDPDHIAFGWFGLLPDEIVMHLFSFLSPAEILRTRRVCSKWRRLTAESMLWKQICERNSFTQPLTRAVPWEWLFMSWTREFKNLERAQGVGSFSYEEGCEYQGEFQHGQRHGFGILLKQQSRYEGEWYADKRHGQGYCEFPNGSIYEGELRNDLLEGLGVKRWPNGSCYTGEWRNGLQHGRGTLHWHDGEKYEGEWEGGFQTGRGRYSWPDGDEYDGNWHKDLLQGPGRHLWHDGCSFVGEWRDGKRHGLGTYSWPDGSVYEGNFLDSKRHGPGTMRWSDGTVYSGMWAGDIRVANQQNQPTNRIWDLFFHKSYDQQRSYVREVMQNSSHQPVASLT